MLKPTITMIPSDGDNDDDDIKGDPLDSNESGDKTNTTTTTTIDRTCWNTMTSQVGTLYYVAPEVSTQKMTPKGTTTTTTTTTAESASHTV